MARRILIEQFQLNLFVSERLTRTESARVLRALRNSRFQDSLCRGIEVVIRRHPTLRSLRMTLSR